MSDKLSRAKHAAKAPKQHLEAPDTQLSSPRTEKKPSVSSSTLLMSICNIISRLTGFVRTWAMAFALGSTLLSSSYQVANNLPNLLYEMVIGGLIVTAFLPVYMSVKKKLGNSAGNDYASNLFTIMTFFLGVITLLCVAFPSEIVYTQSFFSDQSEMADAVFFFRIFAVQILFYGWSSILSGLANANRDYLWSSIAPIVNNVIVITSFFLYPILAAHDPTLAIYVIAIGSSLGVFAQVVIQFPALKRNGIKLKLRVDLKDPALKETLSIGIPALIIMICSSVAVSVQIAVSYSFADNGPSIINYARLWFTLPYAFLVVPITTALFTELSEMQSDNDTAGVKRAIIGGTNQILFFMLPFMFYLIVYAYPLVTLFHAGAFTEESVWEIATYLAALALALPFYGINTHLQKTFSSIRKLNVFARLYIIASIVRVVLTVIPALMVMNGFSFVTIETLAIAEAIFYLVCDIMLLAYLRKLYGPLGLRSTIKSGLIGVGLGGAGALVGGLLLFALEYFIAPISGSIPLALVYIVICGMVSLVVTFGLAIKLNVKEAAFLVSMFSRFQRRKKGAHAK